MLVRDVMSNLLHDSEHDNFVTNGKKKKTGSNNDFIVPANAENVIERMLESGSIKASRIYKEIITIRGRQLKH